MLRTFLLNILFLSFAALTAAQTGGEIEYEITRQISPEMMRRFGGGSGEESAMPSVITLNQSMRFAGNMASWTMPRPGMQMAGMMPPGAQGQMRRFMPFDSKDYVDFAGGKFLHYIRATSGDDTTTWYLNEEPFEKPADWTVDKKTKKIMGYECKKATATLREATYTVWYTTDIKGVHFCPINGLFPPEGVVLSIESDEQSFVAKKVDLKAAVPATEVTPEIKDAKPITADEMRDMRRKAGERMRAQFQQQMPRQ